MHSELAAIKKTLEDTQKELAQRRKEVEDAKVCAGETPPRIW